MAYLVWFVCGFYVRAWIEAVKDNEANAGTLSAVVAFVFAGLGIYLIGIPG